MPLPELSFSFCVIHSCFMLSYIRSTSLRPLINLSPKYSFQLAGERCEKSFASAEGNKEKEMKLMLDWAFGGFLPTGPAGFAPPGEHLPDPLD